MNPSATLTNRDSTLLGRLTEPFLPPGFGSDPEQHFRARVVVVLSMLVGVVGIVYSILLQTLIDETAIAVATFVACSCIALTPMLLRRGFSFVVQGNWMTLWACGLFYSGASLGPPVLMWQVIYIILLTLIAGWRSAAVWLVIMSAATAYFYISLVSGVPEGQTIGVEPNEMMFEMTLVIGMFVTVMLLMVASQRVKNWALNEVQRQETRTRAILEAAPDGIITLTRDGRVREVNPAAEELFDYKRSDVEEAPFVSLIPEIEDAPKGLSNVREEDDNKAGGEVVKPSPEVGDQDKQGLWGWVDESYETQAVRKDGERFPAALSLTPIEDDDRFVAIVRDITERKQAQKKLENARDAAVEANEAKSRFLANISHELRTPLNAIIGYSELVGEDLDMIGEDRLGDDVGKIETAGRHLLDLINEILDLSKVEAGKMELFVEEVDIETVIGEITDTLKPVIDKNDNTLRVDIADAPKTMNVDRMKLRQIMMNLLSNASKFTEEGLVRVHVFSEVDDGREFGVFEVIDRGIGIPEQKLDELFEAFTQADESTTRDFGGTGLGLTICKHFTEMMGGSIDVESTVGEGSTFRFKLPVDVDENRQDAGADDTEEDGPASVLDAPADADRVLVIDDDPTVHQLMERFLGREDFAVQTTTGGKDVLETVRDFEPDIITLDVLMPEIDGWHILKRLKEDDQLADIPVVMLTMINERNMGFSLGATDYLTKPVDPSRLTDVLSSHLDENRDAPILIVEDDEDTREIMRRNVEDAGWEVICAVDGREALDRLDEGVEPGAILLDLMMPRLDGFEVLEQLRGDDVDKEIPVIVVSAADLSKAERQMLEENVDQILAKKDFAKEQLISELRSTLNDDQSHSENEPVAEGEPV